MTLGFASAQPARGGRTNLQVKVNGQEVVGGAPGEERDGRLPQRQPGQRVQRGRGPVRRRPAAEGGERNHARPRGGGAVPRPRRPQAAARRSHVRRHPAGSRPRGGRRSKAADHAAPRRPKRLPTLFIIGDSTVNNHTKGLQGWGDPIADAFDTAKIHVENRARGGRSSRTYQTEGLWDQVLADMKPGDFVLMQFGHNDGGPVEGGERPRLAEGQRRGDARSHGRPTGKKEVVHTYGWYMRKYVADARAKGATPVVLSPVPAKPVGRRRQGAAGGERLRQVGGGGGEGRRRGVHRPQRVGGPALRGGGAGEGEERCISARTTRTRRRPAPGSTPRRWSRG